MKILAVSDEVVDFLYSPRIKIDYSDVELILSCGDLPLDYLEFMANTLEVPLYFVWGNHDVGTERHLPNLCLPLDGRTVTLPFGIGKNNPSPFTLLLAGLGGSIRYKPTGKNQYTQKEMFLRAMGLVPGFLHNHHHFGRYVDIFISHSPPYHIHDQEDRAHTGLKAFVPILDLFQPEWHLHGHISIYEPDSKRISQYGKTKIININPFRIIEYTPPPSNINILGVSPPV
jgi:hypothetical protein